MTIRDILYVYVTSSKRVEINNVTNLSVQLCVPIYYRLKYPFTGKECSNSQYQCNDGTCIDMHYICDSYPDCKDKSDETNCGKLLPFVLFCIIPTQHVKDFVPGIMHTHILSEYR